MNQLKKLDKKLAEYRQNFYNIYHSKIVPIFSEFEKERRERLTWLVILLLVVVIILCTIASIIFSCLFTEHFIAFVFCLWFVVVGLVASYYIITSTNSGFVKKLKASCMQKVTKSFGNMNWYDQYKLIPDSNLHMSQIFAKFNERTSYDAFKGAYKGVDFEIEEVRLLDESGSGRNKTTIDVFRGVIIKVPVNKTVKGTTIV